MWNAHDVGFVQMAQYLFGDDQGVSTVDKLTEMKEFKQACTVDEWSAYKQQVADWMNLEVVR